MVAEHQLFRIRIEINPPMHPIRDRMATQVVLQQRQRHDQRHQALLVVLDQAQRLVLVLAREMIGQGAKTIRFLRLTA